MFKGVVEVPRPPLARPRGTSKVTAPEKVVVVKVEVPETERAPATVVRIVEREMVTPVAEEVPILIVPDRSKLITLATPVRVEVPVTESVPSVEILVERVVTARTVR